MSNHCSAVVFFNIDHDMMMYSVPYGLSHQGRGFNTNKYSIFGDVALKGPSPYCTEEDCNKYTIINPVINIRLILSLFSGQASQSQLEWLFEYCRFFCESTAVHFYVHWCDNWRPLLSRGHESGHRGWCHMFRFDVLFWILHKILGAISNVKFNLQTAGAGAVAASPPPTCNNSFLWETFIKVLFLNFCETPFLHT